MSNSLSCGPFSVSNSSRYDMPEQPPPLTPMRRNAVSGRFCACLSSFTCFVAASDSATAMPGPSRLFRCRAGRHRCLLVLVVGERGLDRVLGQHRAVDLHRRQLQLVDDVGVLDLRRLVDAMALPQPKVLNLASSMTPVSRLTLICSFITSPHSGAPTSPVPTPGVSLPKDPTLRGLL